MRLPVSVVLLALALPTAAGARVFHPRITVRVDPVVVVGTGFRPRERVRVTLLVARTYTRRVVATRRGTFRVLFASASVETCKGYAATATGARGSRARFAVAPACPPSGP